MSESQQGPTAQKILQYLTTNRGTAFTAEDVCEAVDCSTSQAHAELETLADAGLVERRSAGAGPPTYLIQR